MNPSALMPNMPAVHTTVYAVPLTDAYECLVASFLRSGELQQHQRVAAAAYLTLVIDKHRVAVVLTAPDAAHTALHVHRHPAGGETPAGPLSTRIAHYYWKQCAQALQERCARMLGVTALPEQSSTLLEQSVGGEQ